MNGYGLYVFDLDGTVYRGKEPVPHAADTIQALVHRGAMVRFFTNNSGARPAQVSKKLNAMGVPCEDAWVYGTGALAARECVTSSIERAFVVGEPELAQTLAESGVLVTDEKPGAVVVGICRAFDYALLDKAARLVRDGARLIVTNRDATYPIEGGEEQPGAGAIAAAVETASNVRVTALGKPEPALLLWATQDAGNPKSLVIGDRMDTDIECGKRAGCDTWLALTGVTKVLPTGQPGGGDLRDLLGL